MKRLLLLIAALFMVAAASGVHAQERSSSLVVIGDETYYVHTVSRHDSMDGLAALYGVSELDIIRNNPHVVAGLKEGQKVKVPYDTTSSGNVSDSRRNRLYITHTVNQGETLFGLARRYGVPVPVLIEDNPGIDPNVIRVGQQIWVRRSSEGTASEQELVRQTEEYRDNLNAVSSDFRYHLVERGETIWGLSRQYGLTEEDLTGNNDLSRGLIAGSIIKIPRVSGSGRVVAAATAADNSERLLELREREQALVRQTDAEAERLERERLAREQAEQERIAQEQAERERITRQEAERREQERLEQEKAEQARFEAERAEQERFEKEQAEEARLEAERLEQERLIREQAEQERLAQEQAERERITRQEAERREQERLDRERAEQARLEAERAEQERLEREQQEQARLEAERLEQERLAREQAEQEHILQEQAERERITRQETERREQERLEQEKTEQARIEAERAEQARLEAERLESERLTREAEERSSRESRAGSSVSTQADIGATRAIAGISGGSSESQGDLDRAISSFDAFFSGDAETVLTSSQISETAQVYPPEQRNSQWLQMWPFRRDTTSKAHVEVRDISERAQINVAMMLPLKGTNAENYLDFYQGALLAMEDLKAEGHSARLSLYDTTDPSRSVGTLVESFEFTENNLVIGPVYENELAPVLSFAEQRGVAVVSPLATIQQEQSPVLYQMAPDPATRYDKLKALFSTDKNIVFVSTPYPDDALENAIKPWLSAQMPGTRFLQYNATARTQPKFFEDVLEKRGENLFVISCTDEAMVDNILATLSSTHLDQRQRSISTADLRVVGSHRWASFDRNVIDKKLFFRVNYCYVPNYHADRSDPAVLNFDRRYISAFGFLPSRYSYRGYEAVKLFVGAATVYGSDFTYKVNTNTSGLLQMPYRFVQHQRGGTYVNDQWPLVCYGSDFTITVH